MTVSVASGALDDAFKSLTYFKFTLHYSHGRNKIEKAYLLLFFMTSSLVWGNLHSNVVEIVKYSLEKKQQLHACAPTI